MMKRERKQVEVEMVLAWMSMLIASVCSQTHLKLQYPSQYYLIVSNLYLLVEIPLQ